MVSFKKWVFLLLYHKFFEKSSAAPTQIYIYIYKVTFLKNLTPLYSRGKKNPEWKLVHQTLFPAKCEAADRFILYTHESFSRAAPKKTNKIQETKKKGKPAIYSTFSILEAEKILGLILSITQYCLPNERQLIVLFYMLMRASQEPK